MTPGRAVLFLLLALLPLSPGQGADAPLRVLPDAGHMANMEQPAAFNDALGRFLQRHA